MDAGSTVRSEAKEANVHLTYLPSIRDMITFTDGRHDVHLRTHNHTHTHTYTDTHTLSHTQLRVQYSTGPGLELKR